MTGMERSLKCFAPFSFRALTSQAPDISERSRAPALLRLTFSRDSASGHTFLADSFQEAPLKVVRAFILEDGTALAHLHNICRVGLEAGAWRDAEDRLRELTTSIVSQAAMTAGVPAKLGLRKLVRAVNPCRRIGKKDMVHNSAAPNIEVDPETYEVRVDGKMISCEPASVLSLAQRYFLF